MDLLFADRFSHSLLSAILVCMKRASITLCILMAFLAMALLCSCQTTERLERTETQNILFPEYMEHAGIYSFSSTLPVYYHNGAQWNAHSLELIEQATDYILISTFLGVEHPSSNPVWEALAKKAKEGVRVYIIIDSSSNFQVVPGSNEVIQSAFMYLGELGLEVVEYNPFSMSNLFYLPLLLDRDHRKYWVVDGKMLAAGGINVNHSSIDWPSGLGAIDTMAQVVSPGATEAVVRTFVQTWNAYSPKHLDAADFPVSSELPLGEPLVDLWLVDHYWPSRSQVSSLFDAFSIYAQQELWLIQGYTFLTPALLDRIRYAVKKGVAVHIMLSEHATQPKYEMASRYGALDLIDAGATVYMYDSPESAFLHLKLMVADGKLVTIGSANYNLRSQTYSREMNFVFDDERIGRYSLDYIETLLEHCRIVSREEAQSYRNVRNFFNFLLMQVWG